MAKRQALRSKECLKLGVDKIVADGRKLEMNSWSHLKKYRMLEMYYTS